MYFVDYYEDLYPTETFNSQFAMSDVRREFQWDNSLLNQANISFVTTIRALFVSSLKNQYNFFLVFCLEILETIIFNTIYICRSFCPWDRIVPFFSVDFTQSKTTTYVVYKSQWYNIDCKNIFVSFFLLWCVWSLLYIQIHRYIISLVRLGI